MGKKVFLANEDAAIASPEATLTNALNQAVDYVQPTQSVVGFSGVSGVKYRCGYSLPNGCGTYLYVC